ncbi:MAG: VIT1/CCC1 transporter family protein [Firmicutes bacterium]|nr:VIT1/CCC1 transporter family protein [Bacillota bacterium]
MTSRAGGVPARIPPAVARSVREVVLGVNDGLVSITGILVGVTASRMALHQVLIAGWAAVVAATLSMALGTYLSVSAQNEFFRAQKAREVYEVHTVPHEERQEVAGIYRAQGFTPEQVDWLTAHTTADPERWVDFMMRHEIGIVLDSLDSPWHAALVMAAAVLGGALPPLLPFLLAPSTGAALPWAIALAVLTAFGLGAVKAVVAGSGPWRSGVQFVLAIAAAVLGGAAGGHLLGQWLG